MPLLRIQQLRKSFPGPAGRRDVVHIDHFELAPGEELAIEGESGSGKSTFLNLVAGIVAPDSGSIVLHGTNIAALKESARDRWRAEQIGYVFQSFNLLHGYTCLENVLLAMSFAGRADRQRAERLLSQVGLGSHLNNRPRQLSWGQQQRVAVARALANQPSLVLADEPTGNLDPGNARDVIALIRESCRAARAALLLVSHDRDVLARFEHRRSMSDLNTTSPRRPG